jgi:Kinase binding protein CGI-121.
MRRKNIAKDKAIELLLRTSGERQISKAINILGVNYSTKKIILLACDTNIDNLINVMNEIISKYHLNIDDKLMEVNEERKSEIIKIYNLKTNEIDKEILTKISAIEWLQ